MENRQKPGAANSQDRMKRPSKKRKYIKLNILWRLVAHHAVAIILTGLAVALISALGATYFLHLNSNQDSLVSPSVPFQKRYLEHLKNFGDQEYLFVVIQTGGTKEGKTRAAQFAERLNGRLQKYPDLVQAVYYRISPDDLGNGVLLFASPEEARMLTRTISFIAPYLDQWFQDGSSDGPVQHHGGSVGRRGANPQ